VKPIIAAVSGVLFLFFLAVFAANWAIICYFRKRSERNISLVPVAGGVAGAIAMLLFPYANFRLYAWIPLFVDVTCLPMVVWALIVEVCRSKRGRS